MCDAVVMLPEIPDIVRPAGCGVRNAIPDILTRLGYGEIHEIAVKMTLNTCHFIFDSIQAHCVAESVPDALIPFLDFVGGVSEASLDVS